jgi:hypothetical protein
MEILRNGIRVVMYAILTFLVFITLLSAFKVYEIEPTHKRSYTDMQEARKSIRECQASGKRASVLMTLDETIVTCE